MTDRPERIDEPRPDDHDAADTDPGLAAPEESRNDLGREPQPEDAAAVERAGERVDRTERQNRQTGDAAAITPMRGTDEADA